MGYQEWKEKALNLKELKKFAWMKLFDVSGAFELIMSDDLKDDSTSPEKDLNKGQDRHTRKQT